MNYNILAINPGSTSTKVAVFENEKELFRSEIIHEQDKLSSFKKMTDQLPMRINTIKEALDIGGVDIHSLSGVVGRGGMIPRLGVGGYNVNADMREIIINGNLISHASNLGALMAYEIANPLGIPAIIYDAVSADNMIDVARITGMPEIKRVSFCHVLNSRAMARKYAESIGRDYNDMRLLVAHLGGGISISAHLDGLIIDVISDDGGPFSPERAGSVPLLEMIDICFSGVYTKEQVIKKQRGNGGLRALLGTSDCREIEAKILAGDKHAALCYKAQAYQIAKGIGNLAPALNCKMDAIILTGGVANSKMLTDIVSDYVKAIAPVIVLPGENEMQSLALGMLRILRGEERVEEYKAGDVYANEK